jgi:hypothetical protein
MTGPVAQLVEQGTFNPKVAGSKPARPIAKDQLNAIILYSSHSGFCRLRVRDDVQSEPILIA